MNLLVDEFLSPAVTTNDDGQMRRVGFEFEFTGLDFEVTAEMIVEQLGGRVRSESCFHLIVEGTEWGDVDLEVDATLLKERAHLRLLEPLGLAPADADDMRKLETWIRDVSSAIVPYEIVTPPIAIDNLAPVDELRRRLQAAGAQGTSTSFLHGFGLHINPEAPSLSAGSLWAHTCAFLLLYDWIKELAPTDWTRNLSPFIDPFPEAYVAATTTNDGQDLDTFVDEYLRLNPTRNRALDLLPLLAHTAGQERVAAVVGDVSSRPAYHYRLPDCRLSNPDWRIAHAWNTWIAVERLAANADLLNHLRQRRVEGGDEGLQVALKKELPQLWT